MAFATRTLRILCKVHNASARGMYCTFRRPSTQSPLVQVAKKHFCSNKAINQPRITGSLTNIQSIGGSQTLLQETLDKKKQDEENKEDTEEKERRERSKKLMKYSFMGFGTLVGVGLCVLVYELGTPGRDEQGNTIQDEFSQLPYFEQIYKRLKREINYFTKFVQEPSRDKLLPDPLQFPYIQPPYTLVLEMTDVLVHPDWTYQTGWRFKKRPGVDYFLETIAPPQFEIVVYTAEQGMTVFPILDALDPHGYIMYRLVRDATHFVDGHHVKDLDALNRDLRKVIVVDWNADSVKFHPENTLKIPRWTGNDNDTALYDLAAFLKTILASNVEDVRDVLTYYRQFENPLEAFRENQRKLLIQMKEEENKAKEEGSKVLTSKWKSYLRNR